MAEPAMCLEICRQDTLTQARTGVLHTAHGPVRTPVFMPVGTQATVKTMSPAELVDLGFQIILGNTYHLHLRPGVDTIRKAGGLHRFMGWDRAILTDSGGYQVFSLSKLRRVTPEGVHFQSHVDGASLFLGPREAMQIQRDLGADIAMAFDECTAYPATHEEAEKSLELTLAWARVCREQARAEGQRVFGIVQGGMYADLRERAAAEIMTLGFDGYAIGGVSVGEPEPVMLDVLDRTLPLLPPDRPRYLMGVGTPAQLIAAIARGVDMFDCVLPTRAGRNGSAYTDSGCIPIKAGRFKTDYGPIQADCACYACQHFSRAYIRHLLNVNEILGHRLMTMHNLHYYADLINRARTSIEHGTFAAFHDHILGQEDQRRGRAQDREG